MIDARQALIRKHRRPLRGTSAPSPLAQERPRPRRVQLNDILIIGRDTVVLTAAEDARDRPRLEETAPALCRSGGGSELLPAAEGLIVHSVAGITLLDLAAA